MLPAAPLALYITIKADALPQPRAARAEAAVGRPWEGEMAKRYEFLSAEQVEQFLETGLVVVPECFPREVAREWTDHAYARLGYDRLDPGTWTAGRIHMPTARYVDIREFAPRAWGAACELVGGAERVRPPFGIGDGFIVNFHDGADRPWQPPSAHSPGWHKDGDFFRHFLDSPEQGLLTLVIWSDIEPRGGGTFVATDSVPVVARLLAGHPEGLLPNQFDFRALIVQCDGFLECTGRAGDIVLLHPYILHASSQNPSGRPRFLTNPPLHLREPMCFHREDPEDYSLVELAVLRGLGVDHLDFSPTGPRERVIPERERIQARMLEEERARLAAERPGG